MTATSSPSTASSVSLISSAPSSSACKSDQPPPRPPKVTDAPSDRNYSTLPNRTKAKGLSRDDLSLPSPSKRPAVVTPVAPLQLGSASLRGGALRALPPPAGAASPSSTVPAGVSTPPSSAQRPGKRQIARAKQPGVARPHAATLGRNINVAALELNATAEPSLSASASSSSALTNATLATSPVTAPTTPVQGSGSSSSLDGSSELDGAGSPHATSPVHESDAIEHSLGKSATLRGVPGERAIAPKPPQRAFSPPRSGPGASPNPVVASSAVVAAIAASASSSSNEARAKSPPLSLRGIPGLIRTKSPPQVIRTKGAKSPPSKRKDKDKDKDRDKDDKEEKEQLLMSPRNLLQMASDHLKYV